MPLPIFLSISSSTWSLSVLRRLKSRGNAGSPSLMLSDCPGLPQARSSSALQTAARIAAGCLTASLIRARVLMLSSGSALAASRAQRSNDGSAGYRDRPFSSTEKRARLSPSSCLREGGSVPHAIVVGSDATRPPEAGRRSRRCASPPGKPPCRGPGSSGTGIRHRPTRHWR